MKRLKVKDIMTSDVVALDEDENLEIAEYVMNKRRIRHLPVVNGKKLVGLVTHRDLLSAKVSSLAEMEPEDSINLSFSVKAADIMSKKVQIVSPEASLLEAARILKDNKYGCLPVVEGESLVGILTEADFIDIVIRALERA
jgi:CBS domain-containing membrane protein